MKKEQYTPQQVAQIIRDFEVYRENVQHLKRRGHQNPNLYQRVKKAAEKIPVSIRNNFCIDMELDGLAREFKDNYSSIRTFKF